MRFVLDTNTVIGALNRRKEVLERLRDVSVEDVAIPLVSIAELFYGAFRSARREENLAKVRNLYESFVILPLNNTVVEHYGSTRVALEARGRPLTDFDLLIACTALAHDAVLVTDDQALQQCNIHGLAVENWLVH